MVQSIVNPFLSFFNSIYNIGTDPKRDASDNFQIKFLNVVAIAVTVVILMALPVVGFERDWFFYLPIVLMCVFPIVGIYFNSKRQHKWAKIFILISVPVVQFINLLYIDTESIGIEMSFIPFTLLASFLFEDKWEKIGLVSLFMIMFSIIFIGRDYPLNIVFIYTPIAIIVGLILGVIVVFNHLQYTTKELRKYVAQLTTQNKNLEDLVVQNDLKTELLGILSHDLKGPAAAFNQISKKVSFLLKKERYDELVEFGNYFEVAGDKIYHDIDRLLNWTVAHKKDIIIRIEEIPPHRLIDRIAEGLQYQVRDKEVSFDNKIDKEVNLSTDKHILEIIVKNLLINAANHSDDKEDVNITFLEEPDYHVISIHNKGAAIDMNIVEQAQKGRYRKSKAGHGLGLGICFSLIKFLNGEIEFLSDELVGTTALVKLPVEQ